MLHLNSLRGIAALLVVFYHIKHLLVELVPPTINSVLSQSYLAVDFFFVLSGYILTWKYLQEVKSKPFIEFTILFIKKRLIRIYPLHFLLLIAYITIPMALFVTGRLITERYTFEMFVPHIFLIQSWGLFNTVGWNIPSWSISTEFLAYISFPFVCFIIIRISQTAATILLLMFSVIMITMFTYYSASNIGEYISSLGWLRCLAGFYVGFFVHLIMSKKQYVQLIFIVISGLFITYAILNNLNNYFYINLLFAVSLFFIIKYSSFFQIILVNKPLLFLGNISYSLYLVHYFVRDILTMLLLKNGELASGSWLVYYLALTLLISVLTYRLIEVKLKDKLTSKLIYKHKTP